MNFREDEISADTSQNTNKVACSVETTVAKLNGDGFTKRELTLFEARVKGTCNHKFFQNFSKISEKSTGFFKTLIH